jgi:hypothetical protein
LHRSPIRPKSLQPIWETQRLGIETARRAPPNVADPDSTLIFEEICVNVSGVSHTRTLSTRLFCRFAGLLPELENLPIAGSCVRPRLSQDLAPDIDDLTGRLLLVVVAALSCRQTSASSRQTVLQSPGFWLSKVCLWVAISVGAGGTSAGWSAAQPAPVFRCFGTDIASSG